MLLIMVQNQLHEEIRSFIDTRNLWLVFTRRAGANGAQVLPFVDPYADTMFNFRQIEAAIREIDDELASSSDISFQEQQRALEVRAASLEARTTAGYIFFVGD